MKAVFLDRDGTLIKNSMYLDNPVKIRILPGVIEGLKKLKKAGFKFFVVTNQSGVARGFFSLNRLKEIHKWLDLMFKQNHIYIIDWQFCPNHPREGVICRKPRPGMILKILKKYPEIDLRKSWIIGDYKDDVYLGKNLNIRTIFIKGKHPLCKDADFIANNFMEAVNIILENDT